MGSLSADKMPQLTKQSFAIINSATSYDKREHWIMIAKMDKTYYFDNSLGEKRSS